MNKNVKTALVPKLRFPEFHSTGEWDRRTLDEIADRITEKVGDRALTTLSISAGIGFVSQAEKFSRDISGKQYENYIVLRKGEFSYNKGNSKKFPQGCIYELKEYEEAAVPNAFISFRFKDSFVSDFYKGYFDNNYHGVQLTKFITSGARMDGLLNINPSDFFSILLPTPKEKEEQQKIADCLSSLDDLIASENEKFKALKAHKKGLMQKLLPAEGETVPEWRFPEFRDSGEWELNTVEQISINVIAGGTPSTLEPKFWNGDIRWMNSGDLNFKKVYEVKGRISEEGLQKSSTKLIPKLCVLIGLAGQGKTRGTVAINMVELCINQSIAAIFPNDTVFDSSFIYHNLDSRYDELRKLSTGDGGRGGLNLQIIKSLPISLPAIPEQQKIADCLSIVDDLITAQVQKVETLKVHKKGLMQGLFPSIEEVGE